MNLLLQHSPEYLVGLLQNCEEELERMKTLYRLARTALLEHEAKRMHGTFTAAARGVSIEDCLNKMDHKLRIQCPDCGGTGTGIEGEQGAQYQTSCEDCEGSGFIQLPALHWMQNGKVQFRRSWPCP